MVFLITRVGMSYLWVKCLDCRLCVLPPPTALALAFLSEQVWMMSPSPGSKAAQSLTRVF